MEINSVEEKFELITRNLQVGIYTYLHLNEHFQA